MRLLRLVIECATPLHCGGGDDPLQDQPVARDAFGYWRLPGSSLAGSLRALADTLDPALARQLFGDQQGDESNPSLVWCEDGLLLDYDGKPALAALLAGKTPQIQAPQFIRDHVRIGLESGAVADGGKFDVEFAPAGARFLLEFRCDGWSGPLKPEQAAFFERLCDEILAGNLSIGGKSGLGYGIYTVLGHELRHLDLTTPEDMAAWLALAPFDAPALDTADESAGPEAAGPGLDGWVELPLVCSGPILIGGGGAAGRKEKASDADILFALTPGLDYEKREVIWSPTLPASAIRGVFRHAAHGVLRDRGAGDALLDSLFGFVNGDQGQCGKIVARDCPLESPQGTRLEGTAGFKLEQHVALDRFSAAPIDGALFSEEPLWVDKLKATLRLRACNLDAAEAALFLHALLDWLDGSLGIGSGVMRGNGRLYLPGWRENPEEAAKGIKGNLAWNGEKIFNGGLDTLKKLAPEWDTALDQALSGREGK